jgi:hypothetical protein
METNHLELATNAITIDCVKGTHAHLNLSPMHQKNAQVTHWNISAVNINGTPIADWCAQFELDAQDLFGHYFTNPFKTKKAALSWAVETFADFVQSIDPEENWFRAEEVIDACAAAFTSIKGGK